MSTNRPQNVEIQVTSLLFLLFSFLFPFFSFLSSSSSYSPSVSLARIFPAKRREKDRRRDGREEEYGNVGKVINVLENLFLNYITNHISFGPIDRHKIKELQTHRLTTYQPVLSIFLSSYSVFLLFLLLLPPLLVLLV